MERLFIARPARKRGIIFQAGVLFLLAAGGGWGLWRAFNTAIGPEFVLILLPTGLLLALAPFLAYRLQSLRNASYIIERNGIQLQWGLRLVQIPMDRVEWIQLEERLTGRLPRPWLYWPGSVLGVRRIPDGMVEYLAGSSRSLVVIGASDRYFVISPDDPDGFIAAGQRYLELGALAPLTSRSEQPAFLLARLWRAPWARLLVLLGLGLNLLLLVGISLAVPGRSQVVLGFMPGAASVPAFRLLLLPVVSGFFYFADFFLGLFFFRRGLAQSPAEAANAPSRRADAELADMPYLFLSHLLWLGGVVTAVLFLLGAGFILFSGA